VKKHSDHLNRSFEWIRGHLSATNLDTPDEFLGEWIFEDDADDPRPAGFHFAVFAYGFLQRELLTSGRPPTEKHAFSADVLHDRFVRWQLKLALAKIHRMTDLQMAPLPLFAFSDDEEVTCWSKPDGT